MSLEIPWTEKYRPKTFNDIVSQSIAVSSLEEFIKTPNMPHMIFTGPAGTGKTSTALIIARELLKEDDYYQNVLELNASDTVRMGYVREILKSFVTQKMMLSDKSIKIVILDEADNIPGQVQQALRRIIEKASVNIKFILLCNYINRIIDPIISRCAVFRFVNLPRGKIIERLKFIAEKEKIQISDDQSEKFYDLLFFISGGDLRKAINTLQMAVALDLIGNLDMNEILKISGFLDEDKLKEMVIALKNRDFMKSREILDSIETLDSRNFIRQLIEALKSIKLETNKNPVLKAFIGDIDYRISQGADEKIQVSALLAKIIDNIGE
ncbi:MAG: replication factor C small subunit [Promethearchaeota archaeon]